MARSAADDPEIRLVLTPRQEEILQLIQRGLTNGQIAERLGLSLDGVKWHVREILSRLDVESREEAAAVWRDQHRPAGWVKRALRSLVPWSVGVRVAVGGLGLAGVIAGGGLLLAARSSSDHAARPPGVVMDGTALPTPPIPLADNQGACQWADVVNIEEFKIADGAVVLQAKIPKPRDCVLAWPVEAFVLDDASPSPQGSRVLTERATLLAPVGTDVGIVTIVWRNWCRASPGTIGVAPSNHQLWAALPMPIGSGTTYPECISPAQPTTVTITVRADPDPPVAMIPAGTAPKMAAAADLEAFARWFATVVGTRDEAVVSNLLKPVDMTCPPADLAGPDQRHPLCKQAVIGQTLNGYILSQGGKVFGGGFSKVTAGSGNLRAAGCAIDASACERFVVVFESLEFGGPGPYQAFVFEVLHGVPALRGYYSPGGGDRDTIFAGGVGKTPWGDVAFVPLR